MRFFNENHKTRLVVSHPNKEYNCCISLQQLQEFIMWAALFSSIFSVLKSHFDEVILRICIWFSSFILCWITMPERVLDYLLTHPLPALPNYVLFYTFLLTVATCAWQVFFIILDILTSLVGKFLQYKAVNPQSKWVEIDGEYKNYTFFKCHRLSLLLRIKKLSGPAKN